MRAERLGGRSQRAGVSDSTAACRTNVRRPSGVSISSSRSAMSACAGSAPSKPRSQSAQTLPASARSAPATRARATSRPRAPCAQRHHRPERHQVAGGVVERLRGQLLGTVDAGRLGLRVVEAARRLHQRVEAAPSGPRARVAVGRERHGDDAGPHLRAAPRARSRAPPARPAGSPARTRAPRAAGRPAARAPRRPAGRARPRACRDRCRCRARRGPADAAP